MNAQSNIRDLWDTAMDMSGADGTDAVDLLLDTAAMILAYNSGSLKDATARLKESHATSLSARDHLNTTALGRNQHGRTTHSC